MAYIANTAFEARITNKRFDELNNITGIFQANDADEACAAGFLCVTDELIDNVGFTGVKNENAWYMNAATVTSANTPVYACNTYDVQLLADQFDNLFAVGAETLGLAAPKGRFCTFTAIDFDGKSHYRFGVGNLSAALGSNKFFTIANGLLVGSATAPTGAGTPYFKLIGSGNFTRGTRSAFGYVDVIACVA